tara:strand:- start:1570 stop:1830 length:261 start_codon:yes stop_codon:yes gene_type:complete
MKRVISRSEVACNMRAKTVTHVEYEILKHIIKEIEIQDIHDKMVTDEHSATRFDKGATNVANLIKNLADRRKHKIPKDHIDYEAKE